MILVSLSSLATYLKHLKHCCLKPINRVSPVMEEVELTRLEGSSKWHTSNVSIITQVSNVICIKQSSHIHTNISIIIIIIVIWLYLRVCIFQDQLNGVELKITSMMNQILLTMNKLQQSQAETHQKMNELQNELKLVKK